MTRDITAASALHVIKHAPRNAVATPTRRHANGSASPRIFVVTLGSFPAPVLRLLWHHICAYWLALPSRTTPRLPDHDLRIHRLFSFGDACKIIPHCPRPRLSP